MNYYALQERIAKLRAHIRSKRGHGDQQALARLVALRQEEERHRVSSLKTDAFTLMLQELYSPNDLSAALAPHPFLAMLSKAKTDESVPANRAYIIPLCRPGPEDE